MVLESHYIQSWRFCPNNIHPFVRAKYARSGRRIYLVVYWSAISLSAITECQLPCLINITQQEIDILQTSYFFLVVPFTFEKTLLYSTIERNQDKILRSKAAFIAGIKNQVDGREATDVAM